jgi:hypothetical protein
MAQRAGMLSSCKRRRLVQLLVSAACMKRSRVFAEWWMKPRNDSCYHTVLVPSSDDRDYIKYVRMDRPAFEELLGRLCDEISPQD